MKFLKAVSIVLLLSSCNSHSDGEEVPPRKLTIMESSKVISSVRKALSPCFAAMNEMRSFMRRAKYEVESFQRDFDNVRRYNPDFAAEYGAQTSRSINSSTDKYAGYIIQTLGHSVNACLPIKKDVDNNRDKIDEKVDGFEVFVECSKVLNHLEKLRDAMGGKSSAMVSFDDEDGAYTACESWVTKIATSSMATQRAKNPPQPLDSLAVIENPKVASSWELVHPQGDLADRIDYGRPETEADISVECLNGDTLKWIFWNTKFDNPRITIQADDSKSEVTVAYSDDDDNMSYSVALFSVDEKTMRAIASKNHYLAINGDAMNVNVDLWNFVQECSPTSKQGKSLTA